MAIIQKNLLDLADFTRATPATGWVNGRLHEFGINEPRFVTDPATGYSGLLLEPVAQTNLLRDSGCITGLDGFGPTGSVEAVDFPVSTVGFSKGVKFTKADTSSSYAYKTYSYDPSKQYSLGVYVYIEGGVEPKVGHTASDDFMLRLGVIDISGINTEVTHLGSGVYFISTTESELTGGSNFGIRKGSGQSDRVVFATGFQLVEGSYAGSYTPTGASQVTRAGDRFILPTDRFDYRPDRGTLLVDAMVLSGVRNGGRVAALSGSAGESIGVPTILGPEPLPIRQAGAVFRGASIYAVASPERLAEGSKVSSAISWETGGFVAAVNGAVSDVTPYTDDYPIAESLRLATLYNGDSNAGPACIVRRVLYYPERLPDAQLAALTELT